MQNEDGIEANWGLLDGSRVTIERDSTGTMALPHSLYDGSILSLKTGGKTTVTKLPKIQLVLKAGLGE